MDDVDLAGEAGEEGGFLDRGVAAAYDSDGLVTEEEAITGGAPRDTAAGQCVFAGQAQLAVAGAGGEDHGTGVVGLGSGSDRLDVAGDIDFDDVIGDQLGAEPFGLGTHLVHQRGPHDAVGEAWEVLDLGGVHECPASGY